MENEKIQSMDEGTRFLLDLLSKMDLVSALDIAIRTLPNDTEGQSLLLKGRFLPALDRMREHQVALHEALTKARFQLCWQEAEIGDAVEEKPDRPQFVSLLKEIDEALENSASISLTAVISIELLKEAATWMNDRLDPGRCSPLLDRIQSFLDQHKEEKK
ncbi:MAG: hypothetical protein WC824_09805 [Bacteroidota bacterium]